MSEEEIYSARHWAAKAAASAQAAAQSAQNSRGLAIGQLVWSQSSLAKDNPGCLPAWTGEYYPNAAALYPDFYAWVKSHPELCKTKAEYDELVNTAQGCLFYVVDEVEGSLRLPKYKLGGRVLVDSKQPTATSPSWYNLYSDGWLEQGARYETNVNIENITFFKPFASVPLVLTSVQSTSRTSYNDFGIDVYNLTTTGFTKQDLRAVGMGWGWEAKGYAAGTPMGNIKYPWVCAYNAAIPASTAQAAEFIQTVSEMQTSKLDKAASNNFIGFVDTTAGISITLPYTATSNGWICCTWNGDNAYSSGALAIDGVNVFYHLSSARDGRDSYWGSTALIPIRTGQVVTSTGIVPPNGNKLFFPFKNY